MDKTKTTLLAATAVVATGVAINTTTAHADTNTGAPVSATSATAQTPTVKAENTVRLQLR